MEIQKEIYLTLKQQLELAKIEEVQKTSVIQVLDNPQIPLYASNKDIKTKLLLSLIIGIISGISIALVRNFFNSDNIYERRKHLKARTFVLKKSKDLVFDFRVTGLISIILIFFSPFYIGYESSNPVFFGKYSTTLMIVNVLYLFTLTFLIIISIYSFRKSTK